MRQDNITLVTGTTAVQDSHHIYNARLLDMTQQLQSIVLISNTQIHELKESQDWGSAVQGVLPSEVTTSILKVLEGNPYSHFRSSQIKGSHPGR